MCALRLTRFLLVFLLAGSMITANGCGSSTGDTEPGISVDHSTEITFAQLKKITANEEFFRWVGSDRKYHYYKTENGFYCLKSTFKMSSVDIDRYSLENLIEYERKPGSFGLDVIIVGDEIRKRGGTYPDK